MARQELYQAITAKGLAGDEEESTSRAFERQRGAILRVLVRGKCRVFLVISHDRLRSGDSSVCWPGSVGLEEPKNCNRSVLRRMQIRSDSNFKYKKMWCSNSQLFSKRDVLLLSVDINGQPRVDGDALATMHTYGKSAPYGARLLPRSRGYLL